MATMPSELTLPTLREPFATALIDCLGYLFATYDVVGVVASGTVVRGGGDPRSDLDIHLLHAEAFRERIQRWSNGVPCEVFVNPPSRIRQYFTDDCADRRPMTPHMFATGVIVYDPTGIVSELVEEARTALANRPAGSSEESNIWMRYSAATEFEDVDDLASFDRPTAELLLGAAVRRLAECRVALEPGWLPRPKDLLRRLREIDPDSARLAESATTGAFESRLESARKLCRRVTGHDGFFEWSSPREPLIG